MGFGVCSGLWCLILRVGRICGHTEKSMGRVITLPIGDGSDAGSHHHSDHDDAEGQMMLMMTMRKTGFVVDDGGACDAVDAAM